MSAEKHLSIYRKKKKKKNRRARGKERLDPREGKKSLEYCFGRNVWIPMKKT